MRFIYSQSLASPRLFDHLRSWYSTGPRFISPPKLNVTPGQAVDKISKRVLQIRRVARVNSGGKVRSISALVIVGNANGSAGYGLGRGHDLSVAIEKATKMATKSMTWIPRFDNRTVYSDQKVKYHGTMFDVHSTVPGMYFF
jgi:ribosomal protein S5